MRKTKKVKLKAKKRFYDLLLGFFSFTCLILMILVVSREIESLQAYNVAKNALVTFEELTNVESSETPAEVTEVKMGKYKIIGSIKIASIDLEYPILEKTNQEALKLSVTKLSGPPLNELGNVSIAGHSTRNGTLFGKLPSVNLGDIIEITDSKGRTLKYQVHSIYSVLPTDLEPLKTTDENIREITLVSCIKKATKRIIVKAKEIK